MRDANNKDLRFNLEVMVENFFTFTLLLIVLRLQQVTPLS
jgi:hypothetical protein